MEMTTEMDGKTRWENNNNKKIWKKDWNLDSVTKETERGNMLSQEKLCDENSGEKAKYCQLNRKLRSRAI